jgi:hypothetical protein
MAVSLGVVVWVAVVLPEALAAGVPESVVLEALAAVDLDQVAITANTN